MGQRRGRIVFVIAACAFAVASCGAPDNAASPPAAIPTGVTPTATSPTPGPPKTSNDLKTGRKKLVSRSGKLTVNAVYSTPVRRWTPDGRKPLSITLTAFVTGGREQKVYLTQVTVYATGSDGSGPMRGGQPLVDAADVKPGYLVTSPETYSQSFLLPALADGTLKVDIEVKYEFLVLKGASGGSGEYTKQ